MRVPGARIARLTFATAGILALAATVAGAHNPASSTAPQIREGGTIVIGLAEDPDVLDPTLARTFVVRVSSCTCARSFMTSTRTDDRAAARRCAARDLEGQADVQIKIRSGVKVNDGTALTAAAVKRSLDRHLTFKGSTRVSEISPIGSVDVSGSSVILHLKQPFSRCRRSSPRAGMIMSPKALADHGDTFGTNPICVGAFIQGAGRRRPHHARQVTALLRQGERSGRDAEVPDHDRSELAHPEPACGRIQVVDASQSTDVPVLRKDRP